MRISHESYVYICRCRQFMMLIYEACTSLRGTMQHMACTPWNGKTPWIFAMKHQHQSSLALLKTLQKAWCHVANDHYPLQYYIHYKSPANSFRPTNHNPLHPSMVDLKSHEASFFGVNLHEGLIHVSDEFLRRSRRKANVSHWPLHEGRLCKKKKTSKPLKITFLRMRVFQKISTISS